MTFWGSAAVLGHAVEYREEGPFVERAESLGGGLAEEDLGCIHGLAVFLLSVYHDGNLAGEQFLELPQVRGLGMLRHGCLYLLTAESGEYLDVSGRVLVADVEPELVECVGGGVLRREPDVAFLRLAELASVGLGHQGPGQAVCLSAQLTPDKFRAGGYIAPLVTAAHLELAAVVLVEVCEVVALEQLVGELSEGHALASLL